MTALLKRLGNACLLVTSLLLCDFASAEDSQVSVLMLGDTGFHKPSEFYRHLVEPLREQGIELRYTEALSDIE